MAPAYPGFAPLEPRLGQNALSGRVAHHAVFKIAAVYDPIS